MRIALTGASGFIGHWVVDQILAASATPVLLVGDVRCQETFDGRYDALIHLAAATPPKFDESHTEAWDVNVKGTINAIEACARQRCRLVFASTSGVYAPQQTMPVDEDGVIEPTSQYGESKLEGERLCAEGAKGGKIRSTALRIFNPYGPGQPEYMLLSYIVERLRRGERPQLKSPQSGRDFVFVDDVARAFVMVTRGSSDFEVYNVGSGTNTKVIDIFEKMAQAMGIDVQPEYQLPEVPNNSIVADISRILKAYDWRPEMSLDAGVAHLASSFGTLEQSAR